MTLRAGTDADAAHYIRLIGESWAEFPGVVFDVDGELPELRALATHFEGLGGRVWLDAGHPPDDPGAEGPDRADRPLGMIATRPLREDGAWEICRLYVDARARGTGLAHRLLDAAEAHAREHGARRMVLWTDTRFNAAHGFYERRSYVRQGAIRILDDLSRSLEFRYSKPARGLVVEALDAAAAASAERRLADILRECVANGASVDFLHPLAPERARLYWRGVSTEVAQNHRALLAAWWEGELAGTVSLGLTVSENQPGRATVEKLLVDPCFRRRGIGRSLLERAEQAALRLGRSLLTLDTRAGLPGESLYRALGWHEAGRIPAAEMDGTGGMADVVTFWKRAA